MPNSKGTKAVFSVSTYSFQSHSKSNEIRLLDIESGHSTLLVSDLNTSDPTWLGDSNLLLWLKGEEKGETSLLLGDTSDPEQE